MQKAAFCGFQAQLAVILDLWSCKRVSILVPSKHFPLRHQLSRCRFGQQLDQTLLIFQAMQASFVHFYNLVKCITYSYRHQQSFPVQTSIR